MTQTIRPVGERTTRIIVGDRPRPHRLQLPATPATVDYPIFLSVCRDLHDGDQPKWGTR